MVEDTQAKRNVRGKVLSVSEEDKTVVVAVEGEDRYLVVDKNKVSIKERIAE